MDRSCLPPLPLYAYQPTRSPQTLCCITQRKVFDSENYGIFEHASCFFGAILDDCTHDNWIRRRGSTPALVPSVLRLLLVYLLTHTSSSTRNGQKRHTWLLVKEKGFYYPVRHRQSCSGSAKKRCGMMASSQLQFESRTAGLEIKVASFYEWELKRSYDYLTQAAPCGVVRVPDSGRYWTTWKIWRLVNLGSLAFVLLIRPP